MIEALTKACLHYWTVCDWETFLPLYEQLTALRNAAGKDALS